MSKVHRIVESPGGAPKAMPGVSARAIGTRFSGCAAVARTPSSEALVPPAALGRGPAPADLVARLQRAAVRLRRTSSGGQRSGLLGDDDDEYDEEAVDAWVAKATEEANLKRSAGKGTGGAVAKPVADAAAVRDADVCWDFTAGRCKKGASCKWLHLDDDAAKAAAARELSRLGRGVLGAHKESEAHRKLAHLFHEGGLTDGTATKDVAALVGGASPKQQQEWASLCSVSPDGDGRTYKLHVSMPNAGLDDVGMLSWAFWFDQLLEKQGKPAVFEASEINFAGNEVGDYGASILFAVLEKHDVHCDLLRLDGNRLDDPAVRDLARYLTCSDVAAVREVELSGNSLSARGIVWLLACITLHPAFPVWRHEEQRFEPLRLVLGDEFKHGHEDGSARADELLLVLQDLSNSCHMSVVVGDGNGDLSGDFEPSVKSNCVAQLCSLSVPDSLVLPAPAPNARPYFYAVPDDEAAGGGKVAAKSRTLPCVLYEDEKFAVVYKPGGWGCHSSIALGFVDPYNLPPRAMKENMLKMMVGAGDQACFKLWLLLTFGYERSADAVRETEADHGLCHRLDMGTSGPMLVGKTLESYEYAKQQLRDRDVVKDYVALVHGRVAEPRGSCRARIDKSPYEREGKVRIDESGATAVTLYEVVAEYEAPEDPKDQYTLVHLRLITGRTHQIRVHMAHLGHPLVSDWRYMKNREMSNRDERNLCPRIFLHKFRVTFLDMEGFPVSISCPLSMDPQLWCCLQKLRLVGGGALHGCDAPGLRPAKPVERVIRPRHA